MGKNEAIFKEIEAWEAQNGRLPSVATIRRLAQKIGIPLGGRQAEQVRKRWLNKCNIMPADEPMHTLKSWDAYPRIDAPALIISDLHIPFHDREWLEKVLKHAAKRGVRNLVIAGDLLDAKSLSVFPASSSYSYEEELEEAIKVVNRISTVFDVHIILGNHDDRVAKKLDRELSAQMVYSLAFPKATVYAHHHIMVNGTVHAWHIVHPRNYSRVTGQPAHQLVAKLGTSVAIGHTHKWSITKDVSGKHWVVEIGGCFDPSLLDYVHRELSTMPYPQQGALLLNSNGHPTILHPELNL